MLSEHFGSGRKQTCLDHCWARHSPLFDCLFVWLCHLCDLLTIDHCTLQASGITCDSYVTSILTHIQNPIEGSSELNTFPENVVIFFAQIIIYHMLMTGNKKLCGVFGWNIALEWGRKWALKRKNGRKTFLFFSSLAKSAMNWWLVAIFFSLVLGSSVRKTSGRHSRDCLEEYRSVLVIN